jgi:hypothetical protein
VAFQNVQVGPADSAGSRLNQYFIRTDAGDGNIVDGEGRSHLFHHGGFHGSPDCTHRQKGGQVPKFID